MSLNFIVELYSKDNGRITLQGNNLPVGIEDIDITLRRDDLFHGIFPEVSSKLKFLCEGKDYIRGMYERYGIDSEVFCDIKYSCDGTDYMLIYKGKIDYTDIEFNSDYAEANLRPASCVDLFLNRLDTQVNLYDEPCFHELTYDRTARRIRYCYAPYSVYYPEIPILSIMNYSAPSQATIQLDLVCDDDPPPTTPVICGETANLYCVPGGMEAQIIQDDLGLINTDNPCVKGTCFKIPCAGSFDVSVSYCWDVTSFFQWLGVVRPFTTATEQLDLVVQIGTGPPIVLDNLFTRVFGGGGPGTGSQTEYFVNCDSFVLNIARTQAQINAGENNVCFYLEYRYDVRVLANQQPGTFTKETDIIISKFDVSFSTTICNEIPRVGTTTANSYAVHESLSRLVEHYTNNCLKVKSCFFARPNSMECADDPVFQDPASCSFNGSYLPIPDDNCIPVTTFDPTPFQSGSTYGCGAWTVITQGINLRQFGTECFTSFEELFNALDSIFNIGVGYSESEPDVLRVEAKEYFYDSDIVLDIQLDYRKADFKRTPYFNLYYKKFETGYAEWVQDEINTIDEFNTEREYTLSVKNTENILSKRCEYIASMYTFEWQRRQKFTTDSSFDDKIFICCVQRDVNLMNLVEVGVDNPSNSKPIPDPWNPNGFIDPTKVYNWRISPYFNTIRWLNLLRASFYKNNNNPYLYFSKGTVNYYCGGNEPGVDTKCDIGLAHSLLPVVAEISHFENDDILTNAIDYPRTKQFILPEIVTFNYDLTIKEILLLKLYPYKTITVNGERFFVKQIQFRFNQKSKFTLIKAF